MQKQKERSNVLEEVVVSQIFEDPWMFVLGGCGGGFLSKISRNGNQTYQDSLPSATNLLLQPAGAEEHRGHFVSGRNRLQAYRI